MKVASGQQSGNWPLATGFWPLLSYNHAMRSFRLAFLTLAIAWPGFGQPAFQLHGFLSAREIYTSGQPSWLQGGFGRLDTGPSAVNDQTRSTVTRGCWPGCTI
jgi:hypothetical protein